MISLGVTDGFNQIPIGVVVRFADSYDTNGRAVKGTEQPLIEAYADVQPVSSRDLQDLPEGLRNQVDHAIWTAYDVKTDNQIVYGGPEMTYNGLLLFYNGTAMTYGVYRHKVYKTWERRNDGFTKALIGRLK